MKCSCCDRLLTDFEATRKITGTHEYLDMCNSCYSESDLPIMLEVTERYDLADVDEAFDILEESFK